jgi:4,5-dihydroxyphthalate decarboxylase
MKDKNKQPNSFSRRKFLQTSILAGSVLSTTGTKGLIARQKEGSDNLNLKISGYKYKRVEALFNGKVKIEGCDAQFEIAGIGDMNIDVFNGQQSRDVTEIGLHPFMLAYANNDFRDYWLLPVFPMRVFRHRSVFIRTDRGITQPEDLRGKTIATPGYSSTSLTWIRGIFQEEYGVRQEDVQWITSSKDSSAALAGKVSKQENVLPSGVSITPGPAGKDESDLLETGEVDALFHAIEPRAFIEGHPKVARLFSDYRSTERAYFTKTGIFPIMHAVAIKKSTLKKNPWLARNLFDAYSQAKQVAYEYMSKAAWYIDSLPWYAQEFDDTRKLMGNNYYSYGIKSNRKTLETLFRYSYEQGLCSRQLTIEELFESSSLEFVEK